MLPNLRCVIKEKRFESELKRIKTNPRRADDFVEGPEWVLSRDPEQGTQVEEDPPVWFLGIEDDSSHLTAAIYYTFDENHVWLLSIRTI
ncbi:protein of unknown function [Candidatus Methylomirabilis oxygeniifera]|uniref:Uncharacterized protein n=1 Tax=Methylomirabilis oxygeniifera TaxID=671143 RepID=D5MM23_METO1|nr:protein of unknown function [Candidatus Methylomirabilis oxyfera]